MGHRLCPRWLGHLLDNPARRLGVGEALDFARACYLLHKIRDQSGVLRDLALLAPRATKAGGAD